MTEQSDHPTSGRRRRHKSPASIPPVHELPLPRLLDHMGAENGPSWSEEDKDADAQNTVAHRREDLNQTHEEESGQRDETPGVGEFHEGFGRGSNWHRWIDLRVVFRICMGRLCPLYADSKLDHEPNHHHIS